MTKVRDGADLFSNVPAILVEDDIGTTVSAPHTHPYEAANANIQTHIGSAHAPSNANYYVHPSDGIDPGAALTGATVFSDITVNTAGHVTGSATRALTLANLGYTGSLTANDYSHPANHPISVITGLQTALDGKAPTHTHPYLLTTGKAADSEKVDGINGASLLRSDLTDTFSGNYLYMQGDLIVQDAYRDRGLYGSYSSTKTQSIWSMGIAYRSSPTGVGFGSLYGLGYQYNASGLGHCINVVQGGIVGVSLGTNIWTSGNITAYSDIRVKTNLEVIPNALDKVKQLSGYTFDRTDVKYDEQGAALVPLRQTGVVAQEVLEVLPEAVLGGPTEEDPDGHYSVAYGNMVGLLIEAVKEQDRLIQRLEERLEKLEKN